MRRIVFLLVFIGVTATGQEDRHEKIKALKRAYITEALELTTTEAEKFWPIYNAYEEKMHTLKRNERKEFRIFKDDGIETLSESEANALIEKVNDYHAKEYQYRTALLQDLKNVLSAKKILRLKKAEDDFKRQLLKQYRQRKGKE
ncbi:sensor of ECF-type sigma factor [Altibacter sp.]|uniref:sensor of ECF-type sigma factor n=1 Tax=Altibacter sp. TaxID=2024823 RepID=UPI000C976BF2|nr:sensor of ECF-type sigma factor [Altibacter sp.]MAP54976.1 sensor of ECF-type sigma factor [Altibacter sp.]|tara:strand:- start:307 stop:741 length:435 start_codon:yes stop_codon:yes gene_type:complete